MKRLWCVAAVSGVMIGLAASEALAQPGGRGGPKGPGGPPRGGAAHAAPRTAPPTHPSNPPGIRESGRLPGVMTVHNAGNLGSRATAYGWSGAHPQPFSPAWYAEHPNAWQATHPHADLFVAATAVGLAGWLAAPVVPVAVAGSGGGSSAGDTSGATTTTTPSPEPSAAADNPAQTATAASSDDTQWMPLGVFALRLADSARATRMIQLAVSHDGLLRGSHYDLLSDEVESIEGAVNKKDLRATWRIGPRGKVEFQTLLGELTKPEATVAAQFPDGTVGAWKLVQIPK